MSGRRGFLKKLVGLPVMACLAPKLHATSESELPIGCDLSMNSLNWALAIGEERKIGRARRLLIGPENIFPARELLGRPPKKWMSDPMVAAILEDNLVYQLTWRYPKNTWAVQFEHGIVKSVGP